VNIWLERLFLLLIFSLGFMQPGLKYAGMSLPATDFVFATLTLAFIIVCISRRKDWVWDHSYILFGVFLLTMAASAALSVDPTSSWIKFAGTLYLVGLAVISINLVASAETIKRVVIVWLAASTIVSAVAVVTVVLFYLDRDSAWHELFLHHYGSLPVGNYPRVQSTFIYPAMLCNYLSVGTLMIVGARRAGWINGRLVAGLLLLHLIAAAFTLTPGLGGCVAALALWTAWIFIDQGRVGLSACAAGAGIGALLLFTFVAAVSIWPVETSPYTFQIHGTRLDPTQRLLAWQGAIGTFASDPVFGKGIGLGVASVLFRAPSGQMQVLTDAHNTWLSVAGQSGMFGLTAVFALTAHVIRRGWIPGSPSTGIDWIRRSLLIAFVGGFVLQGLVGSFEDSRHLWVLMGLLIAIDRVGRSDLPA